MLKKLTIKLKTINLKLKNITINYPDEQTASFSSVVGKAEINSFPHYKRSFPAGFKRSTSVSLQSKY